MRELIALEELDAGISRVKAQARAWKRAKEKAAAEAYRRFQKELELAQEKRQREALAAAQKENVQGDSGQQKPPMPLDDDSSLHRETEVVLPDPLQHEDEASEKENEEDQEDSWMRLG